MPTIRKTKRLLLPINARERAVVERIIEDQSALLGLSASDAIIRDIKESYMPRGEFACHHTTRVMAGDATLLTSVAEVLGWNITGSFGAVAKPTYLPIVEFGLKLMRWKGLSTTLDLTHPLSHHFRERFSEAVGTLQDAAQKTPASLENYEVIKQAEYGTSLLDEADPTNFTTAPAQAYALFAIENFEIIGGLNCTCAYIADVFSILADTEVRRRDSSASPTPDTPALRREWSEVLEQTTSKWGPP